MKKNKKYIIIRQIPPEIQQNNWLDILDDEYFKDLIVTGNRHYIGKTTDLYDRILTLLDMGVQNIEDVEYVFDELTKDEKEQIVQMYQEYYKDENQFIIRVLEIVTGEVWYHSTIRGYSQGDWQECFHTEEVDIDYIEQVYFGKEDEYEISDLLDTIPDDINEADYIGGYFVAHSERNMEDVLIKAAKEYISKEINIADVEFKIFVHDGYYRVSKYKELEE